MATTTQNYGLKKPALDDFYHVEDQNSNMDIIDTELKRIEDSIPTTEDLSNIEQSVTNLENEITTHKNNTTNHIQNGERENWNTAVEATDIFKKVRSGKDANGIFTTVTLKRRTDNTTYMTSVLSGGTSPQYTTQTIKRYGADGTSVVSTITFTIRYDGDGDWIGVE